MNILQSRQNVQLDTQLLGNPQGVIAFRAATFAMANRMGMTFHAKACKEIDADDFYSLLLNQFRRQQRIEATGNQGDCFNGHRGSGF
jgi:hypothetical protein